MDNPGEPSYHIGWYKPIINRPRSNRLSFSGSFPAAISAALHVRKAWRSHHNATELWDQKKHQRNGGFQQFPELHLSLWCRCMLHTLCQSNLSMGNPNSLWKKSRHMEDFPADQAVFHQRVTHQKSSSPPPAGNLPPPQSRPWWQSRDRWWRRYAVPPEPPAPGRQADYARWWGRILGKILLKHQPAQFNLLHWPVLFEMMNPKLCFRLDIDKRRVILCFE